MAPKGETKPEPRLDETVMFWDLFTCGLQLLSFCFLQYVLETFVVQLHHLTPDRVLNFAMHYWSCQTFGGEADV
jgi:hypothetical protein